MSNDRSLTQDDETTAHTSYLDFSGGSRDSQHGFKRALRLGELPAGEYASVLILRDAFEGLADDDALLALRRDSIQVS